MSDTKNDPAANDVHFLRKCMLAMQRSKDPDTQVGACIADHHGNEVSTGYNGMPYKCPDDTFPWGKGPDHKTNKNFYVCHAEMNALANAMHSGRSTANCLMYVTHFPCNECAKMIIQFGLTKVVYLSDKKPNDERYKASKWMLEVAGVEVRLFTSIERTAFYIE